MRGTSNYVILLPIVDRYDSQSNYLTELSFSTTKSQ